MRPIPTRSYVIVGMPGRAPPDHLVCRKGHGFHCSERARDGQPWLFSVNIFDPHHAFDPPADYLERYLDRLDEIPLPNYAEGELDDKPPYQAFDHDGAYGHTTGFPYDEMSDYDHRLVRAAYWAMCDLIDVQVGRMLATLEETGQLENTMVIFMSDHGEMLGDHGIYLKGPYFYEAGHPRPADRLLARPHSRPACQRRWWSWSTSRPRCWMPRDWPRYPGMQGRSLWPLLTGEAAGDRHRDDVYCEYYNAMPWHRDPTAQTTMVRTGEHKLVVDHGDDLGELYDLVADPTERRQPLG